MNQKLFFIFVLIAICVSLSLAKTPVKNGRAPKKPQKLPDHNNGNKTPQKMGRTFFKRIRNLE